MELDEYREELLTADSPDDGSGNWLNVLEARGWRIHPHCRGVEFEIKYAPRSPAADAPALGGYIRALQGDGLPTRVIAPRWLAVKQVTVEYWLADGVEWSLHRGGERDVLKRKVHRVFHDPESDAPLVQSTEEFHSDAELIVALLGGFAASAGTLHKRRARGHLVHLEAGMVVNLVESRCRIGEDEQIQVELEYGAHVYRGTPSPIRECTPAQIRAVLWAIHRGLASKLRDAGLAPTTERKQDFVVEARNARNWGQ